MPTGTRCFAALNMTLLHVLRLGLLPITDSITPKDKRMVYIHALVFCLLDATCPLQRGLDLVEAGLRPGFHYLLGRLLVAQLLAPEQHQGE